MISNDSITDRKSNENDLQSAATKIGVQDRQLWHKLNLHRTGIVIHLETENRYPSVSNSLLPPLLSHPPGQTSQRSRWAFYRQSLSTPLTLSIEQIQRPSWRRWRSGSTIEGMEKKKRTIDMRRARKVTATAPMVGDRLNVDRAKAN